MFIKIFSYNSIQSIEVFFLPITYRSADILLLAEIEDEGKNWVILFPYLKIKKRKKIQAYFAKERVIAAASTNSTLHWGERVFWRWNIWDWITARNVAALLKCQDLYMSFPSMNVFTWCLLDRYINALWHFKCLYHLCHGKLHKH